MSEEISDEINSLIVEKDFAKAKACLTNLLATDSNNIEAMKLLGLCNVNLGLFKDGKNNFETVVKYKFDDATSWFYLASCYDSLGDFRHAIAAYKKVIELRETYWAAYKKLGVIYIRTKEYDKTVALAELVLKSVQDDYEVYYMAGTALLAFRDYEACIPYFSKALSLNPKHPQIYNNLGTAYLSLGKLNLALENYIEASNLDASNGITYFNIASIFQMSKKYDEACKYFEKAYSLEPSENYLNSWAFTEFKAEKYREAINHYKILIHKNPEKSNYQYNLACCFSELGELGFAAEIIERLIAVNPKSKLMFQKLAEIYGRAHNAVKEKEVYEKMINSGFVSDETYYRYAIVCAKVGSLDVAEKILKKVISLNPKFADARKDLGVIYLNNRLFDYAKEEFETAYKLKPEDVTILFEYANYLHATGDYNKAKELYEKALSKNSSNYKVLAFSALNYIALNEIENAAADIHKALHIAPNESLILEIAGKVRYLSKDYEDAKFYLVKAYEIAPKPDTENLLGLCYFEMGEFKNANNIFLNLIEKNPMNTVLLLNSAKCYVGLNDNAKAKEQLDKLLKIFPEMEEASELLEKISS